MPYSNPSERIRFWAGIMRDHAEFMIMTLSSREREMIKRAEFFKDQFEVLMEASNNIRYHDFENIIKLIFEFIELKTEIVKKLLQCSIEINLPPMLINHMINEALEFYRAVSMIKSREMINPTYENILMHKIWLPDAAGHAAGIASSLDPTETTLIKEAEAFKNTFEHLFIKATELGIMMDRTNLSDGALEYLNEQAAKKITDFICYLEEIEKLRKQCKALGYTNPLLPNHMIREEKYYLAHIGKVNI